MINWGSDKDFTAYARLSSTLRQELPVGHILIQLEDALAAFVCF